MRALCVVQVLLVAVKVENDLGGSNKLQQQSEQQGVVKGVVGGGGDAGSSDENGDDDIDEAYKNFKINISDVPSTECRKYKDLSKKVAEQIRQDKVNVKAKLYKTIDCMCIRMAVKMLKGEKSPLLFNNLYYAYAVEIQNLSNAQIAEKLWSFEEGIMSDEMNPSKPLNFSIMRMRNLLQLWIAIQKKKVKLGYGCAKNDYWAICMFDPFEKKAAEATPVQKNPYSTEERNPQSQSLWLAALTVVKTLWLHVL
ncbi:unnamed protein product [Cylicocyclus nassatus]|uniref:Uncharacterized protein n=1 Tax=Cylicocyclus nassatus TaxID=53992 RepID=A0AA36DPG1_CYLNA|nr:unnamed protein product [Cylicocyclus nassatus]